MVSSVNKPNTCINFIRRFFILFGLDGVLRHFTHNKSSNSLIGKLCPNNYQYGKGSFRKFKSRGIKYEVDISNYMGHLLFYGIKDEAHDSLFDLIKQNDVVLDIGKNIGSTLLNFANLTKGAVFGFEPDPYNYNMCLMNIGLNKFNNLYLENIGLGEVNGRFNLVIDTPINRGCNRISLNRNNKESIIIEVVKLDDWSVRNKLERLDLIKIDVEGFELKVLKGGLNTLMRFKPKLFIEVDDDNLRAVNDSAKELILFLEHLNYKIIHSTEDRSVYSYDPFDNCHYDIICYPLT